MIFQNYTWIDSLQIIEGNLKLKNLKFQEKIFSGNNQIYNVQLQDEKFVLKEILIENEQTLNQVKNEIEILKFLQKEQQYFVQMIDYCIVEKQNEFNPFKQAFILFQQGIFNLQQLIYLQISQISYQPNFLISNQKQQFNNDQILNIFLQLADGFDYLQQNEISHGDIKPENIIVFDKTQLKIKICDFGCARFKQSSELLGTISYMAPEILKNKTNIDQYKADVFSLGLLMINLINDQKFNSRERQHQNIEVQQEIIQFQLKNIKFENISQIIKDCLSYDPKLRPSFQQIKQQIQMQLKPIKSQINTRLNSTRSTIPSTQRSSITQKSSSKLNQIQSKQITTQGNLKQKLVKLKTDQAISGVPKQQFKSITRKNQTFQILPSSRQQFQQSHQSNYIYQNLTLALNFQSQFSENMIQSLTLLKQIERLYIFFDETTVQKETVLINKFLQKALKMTTFLMMNVPNNKCIENVLQIQYLKVKHLQINIIEFNQDIHDHFPNLETLNIRSKEFQIHKFNLIRNLSIQSDKNDIVYEDNLFKHQIQELFLKQQNLLDHLSNQKSIEVLQLRIVKNHQECFEFISTQQQLTSLSLKIKNQDYDITQFIYQLTMLIKLQDLRLNLKTITTSQFKQILNVCNFINIQTLKIKIPWIDTTCNIQTIINQEIHKKFKLFISTEKMNEITIFIDLTQTQNQDQQLCQSVLNFYTKNRQNTYFCLQCRLENRNYIYCQSCLQTHNHKQIIFVGKTEKICQNQQLIEFKGISDYLKKLISVIYL